MITKNNNHNYYQPNTNQNEINKDFLMIIEDRYEILFG